MAASNGRGDKGDAGGARPSSGAGRPAAHHRSDVPVTALRPEHARERALGTRYGC